MPIEPCRLLADARRAGACSLVLAAAMLTAPALAQVRGTQLEIGLQSSIGVTDNVRREPTGEESDTIATIGILGSWFKEEGRLRGEATLDASYYSYLNDTYDGRVIGGVSAFAEYDLIPQRLVWMVRENFGQLEVNPFLSANPGNLQNTNYFTTGPDLIFNLGLRNEGRLYGRFSDIYYETTLGGNKRYEGGLTLRREMSDTTSLSLGASHERVEYYHVPPGSSFDRQEAYLGYAAEGRRTSIDLRGGYTWLQDRGETSDGVLLDASITRQIGAYSRLTLRGGRDFSDSGDVFRYGAETGVGFDDINNAFEVADPFERVYAGISWRTEKDRTDIELTASWRDENYETRTDLDREFRSLRAGVRHALTQLTNISAYVSREWDEFDEGFEEDEWRYTLAYGWQLARPLYLEFTYQRFDRDSSLFSGSAIENQLFVSLSYTYSP